MGQNSISLRLSGCLNNAPSYHDPQRTTLNGGDYWLASLKRAERAVIVLDHFCRKEQIQVSRTPSLSEWNARYQLIRYGDLSRTYKAAARIS